MAAPKQKTTTVTWTPATHGPKEKSKTVDFNDLSDADKRARISGAYKNGLAQGNWPKQTQEKWTNRASALGIQLKW
jgi:hypothetical protein